MTDPNTPDAKRVAEIAERVAKATAEEKSWRSRWRVRGRNHALFGVHARIDIPWLLAQHAALQRMLAESDAVLSDIDRLLEAENINPFPTQKSRARLLEAAVARHTERSGR